VPGALRVLQDIVVERLNGREVTVISATPVARGEQLQLRIDGENGSTWVVSARLFDRRPAIVDGQVMHRLFLEVQSVEGGGA
jgi:hypothetical protein